MISSIKNYIKTYISIRYGLGGALFLGVLVFGINYYDSGNTSGALAAALKQSAYTFIFGGYVSALCERFTSKGKFILGVLIPTAIAIIATYTVHSLKGTPNPELSTVPTLIFAPLGFLFIAFNKRKELKRSSNS
ncbi:hypothetical protein [Flammeovirga kamogawensis]|uniref:DoxX family protein n=1 Tax=Flammeovirga kamogawensis TaxID=373891 RepID=A0ABX8GUS8_9BACT|nr:hypothetical protein [Flammeovirga kamogawensis]MBB6459829.1 hypothetical protein [Flammeovirga kamogawensis]QWG07116.1 hypothetical protein KM029_17715 [Flammeovirga kamogawensis]TRX68937.1 hypothetical protein EO216_12705 [Flammeovirga kamogawensis]